MVKARGVPKLRHCCTKKRNTLNIQIKKFDGTVEIQIGDLSGSSLWARMSYAETEIFWVNLIMRRSFVSLVEDGPHKFDSIKSPEVIHLFADADESDGNLKLAGDSDHNAPLCGAVQFGENNARQAQGFLKSFCL